jgi:hypothetical protein
MVAPLVVLTRMSAALNPVRTLNTASMPAALLFQLRSITETYILRDRVCTFRVKRILPRYRRCWGEGCQRKGVSVEQKGEFFRVSGSYLVTFTT